jgi:transposase
MARWLKECRVKTVAMESTGVYWIGLFEVLQSHGLEVRVVNARHVKYVPGRKSDWVDCQWIQKLHTFGLLKDSFRSADNIQILRRYLRQRESLIASASQCVQRMQKAFTEMNLQLANFISDITGKTGMAILRDIVAGQRDPAKLASHRDHRIHASEQDIQHSLEGNWRDELVFVLKQELDLYDTFQSKVAECDVLVEKHLATLESKVDPTLVPLPPPKKKKRPHGNAPCFDLRSELYRIAGVDLTAIDGIDVQTTQTVLSVIGLDMTRWPTHGHFASWLGLCPDHRISGGRVLKRRTRRIKNRAALALRMAATTLERSKSALGANFRRLKAKLGAPKAITAMAHKLARLIYDMLRYGKAYLDIGMQRYEEKFRQQRTKWLNKQALALGLRLVPAI